MEKQFSEKESLELITQMINNTKRNLNPGDGNPLIIWGISTIIASAAVWIAWDISGNSWAMWLWFLIPVIGIIWSRLAMGGKEKGVKTQIDKTISVISSVMAIACAAVPLVITYLVEKHSEQIPMENPRVLYMIIPFVEILLVSIQMTVMGVITEFKPLKIGGLCGVAISFCTFVAFPFLIQIFMVWALVAMVIPGIKLNLHVKKLRQCQKN